MAAEAALKDVLPGLGAELVAVSHQVCAVKEWSLRCITHQGAIAPAGRVVSPRPAGGPPPIVLIVTGDVLWPVCRRPCMQTVGLEEFQQKYFKGKIYLDPAKARRCCCCCCCAPGRERAARTRVCRHVCVCTHTLCAGSMDVEKVRDNGRVGRCREAHADDLCRCRLAFCGGRRRRSTTHWAESWPRRLTWLTRW